MRIVSIVVAIVKRLNVCLADQFLFGKSAIDKVDGVIQCTIKKPANDTQCKHVFASQGCFIIKIQFLYAILYHSGNRSGKNTIRIQPELSNRIKRLK